MNLLYVLAKWLVPPGYYSIFKKKKDINETLSPIQLRHIYRYEFARKHLTGKTILDAACGTGYGSDILEPYDKYIGIDYADYCISYANEHYNAEHRVFIESDIYLLKEQFQKNYFDSIVSFETIEHTMYPDKILDVFFAILKVGGTLIISIPLNHPDMIYHKKIYTHADILDLLKPFIEQRHIHYKEYVQRHLNIMPLESPLTDKDTGTWIGIFQKL